VFFTTVGHVDNLQVNPEFSAIEIFTFASLFFHVFLDCKFFLTLEGVQTIYDEYTTHPYFFCHKPAWADWLVSERARRRPWKASVTCVCTQGFAKYHLGAVLPVLFMFRRIQ